MGLLNNKKAYLNYEITDTYKAGIELLGFEVKSLRKSQGSLEGSYVTVRGGEAFLVNGFIPPFQEKNTPPTYNPRRNRRLLLNKDEIRKLASIEKTKGLTIIPLSVYNTGKVLKVDLGIARGKKKYDKREALKKQTAERETRREYKDR